MNILKANEITRYSNWTALIYAEAGKGKTSLVKTLEGRTLLLSVDGEDKVVWIGKTET